jgi:hypothetical protein
LQFSYKYGLPPELKELHYRFSGILSRSDLAQLSRAGIIGTAALAELPENELFKLINSDRKRRELFTKIDSLKQEVIMKPVASLAGRSNCGLPDEVEIDGSYDSDRYLVRINGLPIKLTGKSFKYLTKLAWSRVTGDGGWVYKEDLEIGFNQARYLYRLKNEIAAGYPSDWQIVENNRLGYYRLDLRPDKIRINFDNLQNFPDYELQQLAGRNRQNAPSSSGPLPC